MLFSQKKEEFFENFFTDISSVLEDLCQSGFHTVHDSTLQELKEKGETAANYGMQYLSGLLFSLQEELSANRHKFYHGSFARPAKYYTELIEYIELGKEKTAHDKGKSYYLSSI